MAKTCFCEFAVCLAMRACADAVRRWAMVKHGVELYNPCQLVHVWHNHASDLRKNQNSTQLGHVIWGNAGVFPCPPQLFMGQEGTVVSYGQCSGRPGWGKTFLLQEEIAFELLMQRYRRSEDDQD
jgi:hypothetical protein